MALPVRDLPRFWLELGQHANTFDVYADNCAHAPMQHDVIARLRALSIVRHLGGLRYQLRLQQH